jgi:hypothetical protein
MIALTTRLYQLFGGPGAAPGFVPLRPRPVIEGLERREFLSAVPWAAHVAAAPVDTGPILTQPLKNVARNFTNVLPLTITGVQVQNGQLVALGQLGGTTFTAPLTLTATPTADPTCPILNLQLAPIHLNLLGLKVDTSAICLAVSAQSGSGNLLGNLLCGVANLLNNGSPLGNILTGLTSTQLSQLLSGITGLLNGAFGQITAPTSLAGAGGGGAAAAAAPAVNVLHLSLGPVNLNLLGLVVKLDNCANGPVTVDITAQPGPGNLLGNLIASLAHLLDRPANQAAILTHLRAVANEILALI